MQVQFIRNSSREGPTMLYLSLVVSAVFLAIVNGIAFSNREKGVGRASLWSLAGIVALPICANLLLPLIALLTAVVGGVCWAVKARPRWFLASSLGATVAAYAILALPDLWAWDRLKKDYPLESLAQRLAYEDRPRTAPAPADDASDSPAAARLAHLEERVKKEESQFSSSIRTQSLERLHAGVVQQFIDSPGFGEGRMMALRPAPFRLEHKRPEESPIPQPTPAYSPADLAPAPLLPTSEFDFLTAHEDNTIDFLNPGGFGYIQDREHVAGFRPHQFRNPPQAPQRWRVGRLELVGLLKYAEPAVYLSANFPRMDELSEAPTRPLDAFEKEALARLRRGEDPIVQESSQKMRMLGSIRAVPQCLRCHRVQGGELLGAFSYQLSPEEHPSK
jgi:hypothetical protein